MSRKQRGTQFLSIILTLAMVAFVNVPMIAWGDDEPVEPIQGGDTAQVVTVPGDDSQAPVDGATAKTDVDSPAAPDVVDSNLDAVADNDAAPTTSKKLAVAPATAPTEVTVPADSSSDAASAPGGYVQDDESKTVAISSVDGLAWLASVVNGSDEQIAQTLKGYTVTLENNIDLAGEPWTPIGTWSYPFMGTFDGNGKTISNLKIDDSNLRYAGLFGIIKTPASVKNVTINNVSVTAKSEVGALAGSAYTGAVSDCAVTGLIEIQGNYKVGGLAGEGYARITNCSVTGVTGSSIKGIWTSGENLEGDSVGGLLGFTGEAATPTVRIDGCTVSDVSVSGTRKVGGMLGYLHYGVQVNDSTVENVSVTCDLADNPSYLDGNYDTSGIGGFVGVVHGKDDRAPNAGAGSMTNCTVSNSNLYVGETPAMAGYFYGKLRNITAEPTMTNCRASGCTGSTVNKDTTDHKGSDGLVPVAKIGDTEYTSLAEAFTDAIDNDTITLVGDVEVFTRIEKTSDAEVTLDLAGKTIKTIDTSRAFKVQGGILNVKGGTVSSNGAAVSDLNNKTGENAGTGAYGTFLVSDKATLNIEKTTLTNGRPWGMNVVVNSQDAAVNLNNVTINSSYGGGIEVSGGKTTIKDCVFTQTGFFDYCSTNIAASNGGTATIDGGSYTAASYGAYIFNSGGTINIKDGTFDSGKAVLKADKSVEDDPSVINVSGGKFTGAYGIQDGASMSITGGTFLVDPTAYVADGYEAEKTGSTFEVTNQYGTVSATQSDGTPIGTYAEMDDALEAVKEYSGALIECEAGKLIVMGSNHPSVYRSLTINGNGATMILSKTNPAGEQTFSIESYAKLLEDTTLTINNLKNATVWGERSETSGTDKVFTLNMTDCDSVEEYAGQRVYISGASGENHITLTDCDFSGAACAVYSNAAGSLDINNCTFKNNVAGAVNIKTKAESGSMSVNLKNCTFTDCGVGDSDSVLYAAPVRIVAEGDVDLSAHVADCVFSYTGDKTPANGDILLGEGRVGETSKYATVSVSGTAANVQIQRPGDRPDAATNKAHRVVVAPDETVELSNAEVHIVFEANGGSKADDLVGLTGETVTGSLPTPTREGYAFAGWYADETLATPVAQLPKRFPASTTTYYAKWNAVPLDDPTIEVEVPQPSEGDSSYVTVPDEAVEAAAEQAQGALETIKNGDVPSGMDPQDAKAVADLIESAALDDTVSVVVSLKFEEKAEAAVDSDDKAAIEGVFEDGEEVSLYLDLSVAMTVKVSDASGVKNQETVTLDEVSEPLLFEVHVDPALIQGKAVRLAHVHNGVSEVINPESVDREQGIIRFYASSFSTYALLTSETVTVMFESNGGTSVETQTLKFGEKVAKPVDPTREGFVFDGWFSDEALGKVYDFAAPVESSVTLYAKWTTAGVQNSTIKKLAATGDTTGMLAAGAVALTVIAGAVLGMAALRRRVSRGRRI